MKIDSSIYLYSILFVIILFVISYFYWLLYQFNDRALSLSIIYGSLFSQGYKVIRIFPIFLGNKQKLIISSKLTFSFLYVFLQMPKFIRL
tara:strand:- start:8314 stop:8583 length:270 start_codon:yes stop_codon:yes gene_type:complete